MPVENDVRIRTIDGSTIAAVLTVPDDTGGPAPAVLLCQGLSGVKHLVLPEIARRFADDHGLASLRFDYRGCGESEGEKGWIDPRARCDDALYALAWMAEQEGVDRDRLGVYGHSYGGPVAVVTASRDQRVRAVVSVSGPGDGEAMLRSIRASWDWVAFRNRLIVERASVSTGGDRTKVGVPDLFPFSPEFAAAYAKIVESKDGTSAMEKGTATAPPEFWLATAEMMLDFHPQDAARRVVAASLFIHGADDDTAAIEDAREVFTNIVGPKRWSPRTGLAHNDLDAGDGLVGAIDEAGEWFTLHLGPVG